MPSRGGSPPRRTRSGRQRFARPSADSGWRESDRLLRRSEAPAPPPAHLTAFRTPARESCRFAGAGPPCGAGPRRRRAPRDRGGVGRQSIRRSYRRAIGHFRRVAATGRRAASRSKLSSAFAVSRFAPAAAAAAQNSNPTRLAASRSSRSSACRRSSCCPIKRRRLSGTAASSPRSSFVACHCPSRSTIAPRASR